MTILLSSSIEDAIQHGFKQIQLLQGETNFKALFTDKTLNTKTILIGHNYKYFIYLINQVLSLKIIDLLNK